MIQSQMRYKSLKNYETNKKPSLTIPDESYTIKELLKKHTRGMMPEGLNRNGIYLEEDATHDTLDYQKFQRMDITDKHLFKQTQKENLARLATEVKSAKQELYLKRLAKQESEGSTTISEAENKQKTNESAAEVQK